MGQTRVGEADAVHGVIVVGGGQSGLVAACYLARRGLDVGARRGDRGLRRRWR